MLDQATTIPKSWKETTLGDAVKIIDGDRGINYPKNHEFFSDSFCLFLNTKNVPKDSFSFEEKMFVDKEKDSKLRKGKLKRGDFVLTTRGTVGNFAFYSENVPFDNIRINSGMVILRTKDEVLSKSYLNFYLKSYFFNDQVFSLSSGTAQPQLPIRDLTIFQIYLPPLSEQHAIAAVLSSLDDKIELLREQNKTLEATTQAIFKEWFVNFNFPGSTRKMVDSELGEIPEGWRVGNLGEVIEFINGYAFRSDDLLTKAGGNCYKVFKMGNIKKGGGFNPLKTKSYIRKEDSSHLNKYILKKGDLLMSMTDMKDAISLLGHTAIMTSNDEYIVNQRVGLIRVLNDLFINYPFLYLLTNSEDFIGRLRGSANSGVQINLSTDVIKSCKFVLPDKKINKRYNSIAMPIFNKLDANEKQITTLSEFRDTLLSKLMIGEIRVMGFED